MTMKRIAILYTAILLMCITTVNASEATNETIHFTMDSYSTIDANTTLLRRKKILHGIKKKYSKYHQIDENDTISQEMRIIKNTFLIQHEYQKMIDQYQITNHSELNKLAKRLLLKYTVFNKMVVNYINKYSQLSPINYFNVALK